MSAHTQCGGRWYPPGPSKTEGQVISRSTRYPGGAPCLVLSRLTLFSELRTDGQGRAADPAISKIRRRFLLLFINRLRRAL